MLKARMLALLRFSVLLSERNIWVSKDWSDIQVVKPVYQSKQIQKQRRKWEKLFSHSAKFNLILGMILFILGNVIAFLALT
ncbi:hypothetical protein ACNO7K_06445 [Bisgaard Taxon 45]